MALTSTRRRHLKVIAQTNGLAKHQTAHYVWRTTTTTTTIAASATAASLPENERSIEFAQHTDPEFGGAAGENLMVDRRCALQSGTRVVLVVGVVLIVGM